MFPTGGLSNQVTVVLPEPPLTEAVNCRVCPLFPYATLFRSETLTGCSSVTTAVADFEESALLVAVTLTVWALAMLAGAAWRPGVLMFPTGGLSNQVTVVLPEPPLTEAVNCRVCPWESVAVAG